MKEAQWQCDGCSDAVGEVYNSDGEVFVTSIERPEEPNVFIPAPGPNASKHTAEITK